MCSYVFCTPLLDRVTVLFKIEAHVVNCGGMRLTLGAIQSRISFPCTDRRFPSELPSEQFERTKTRREEGVYSRDQTRLRWAGISEETIFPDLEGLGRELSYWFHDNCL
jgi:hypothetical protein